MANLYNKTSVSREKFAEKNKRCSYLSINLYIFRIHSILNSQSSHVDGVSIMRIDLTLRSNFVKVGDERLFLLNELFIHVTRALHIVLAPRSFLTCWLSPLVVARIHGKRLALTEIPI